MVNTNLISNKTPHHISSSMTISKPLCIIVWMYQEMMRWLSRSRLLNGAEKGHVKNFLA
jgi:hypothetical protein